MSVLLAGAYTNSSGTVQYDKFNANKCVSTQYYHSEGHVPPLPLLVLMVESGVGKWFVSVQLVVEGSVSDAHAVVDCNTHLDHIHIPALLAPMPVFGGRVN